MVKQIIRLAILACMAVVSAKFSNCGAVTLEEQAAVRAKIAQLQAQKTDLQNKININNQTIGANIAKIASLGVQIKALDWQHGSSQQIDGTPIPISVPTDVDAAIKMASMADDVKRLEKENATLNSQNQALQSQIGGIDAEIIRQDNILSAPTKQDLQGTLAQEENTLKNLEDDLSRLKGRNGSEEDIRSAEWILEQQRIRTSNIRKQIQDGDFLQTGDPGTPSAPFPATTGAAPATQEGSDGFCVTAITYFPEPQIPPPTPAQDEDPEAFNARKQAYVNSLTLSNVSFKTAQSQKPMVICIGSEAEGAFSKESFQPGGKIALPLNLTFTDESGAAKSLTGAFLLTVDQVFENYAQAAATLPPNKEGEKSQTIVINDASGSFSIKDEKGSAQGNLAMGWSEENKLKALALAKELMMMCFIATAVYGDEHAPQVERLRQFRDEHLLCTSEGRKLVEFYYAHGPQWANTVSDHKWIIPLIRSSLDMLITFLDKTDLHHPIPRWSLRQGILMTNNILNMSGEDAYRDPKAEAYSHLRSIFLHEKSRNKQQE